MPTELTTGVEYFSTQAARWGSLYRFKASFRDRLSLFLGGLTRRVAPPARVLDFGCGPGVMSLALAGMGYEVHGVDGSPRMIEMALAEQRRTGATNARFSQMDAREFTLPENTYDAVICSSVLQYVDDDRKLLSDLVRVLRPGGVLLISVPHGASLLGWAEDASAHLVRMFRFSGRGFMDFSYRRYRKRRFLETLAACSLGSFECTCFEVPLLGSLGIPLSRVGAIGIMLLVTARKAVDAPASPADLPRRAERIAEDRPRLGIRGVVSALMSRAVLTCLYGTGLVLHGILGPLGRRVRGAEPLALNGTGRRAKVLVIGTFYSGNWSLSHLTPLARADSVERVFAVIDGPQKPVDKVTYDVPPAWLSRVCTRAGAKLIWALKVALRERPEIVMGYHLIPGALSALLVARAVGARSAYQATGGPTEIIGGGPTTENFFLRNLRVDSPMVEGLASMAARRFDLIVVRGASAQRFMSWRELGRYVEVVPGSIVAERFAANGQERPIDVVCVSRLVSFKQPNHMLEVFTRLRRLRPGFRAVIVGDGPMMGELKSFAAARGISDNVQFMGHVDDVERVLKQSRVFLLTSKSEGLSIAMAEAMAAGVVPVVARVGDLGDLVRNGETGWLVTPGAFDEYAQRIEELLSSRDAWRHCSEASRDRAVSYNDVNHVAMRWSATVRRVLDDDEVASRGDGSRRPRSKHLSRWQLWQAVPWRLKQGMKPLINLVPNRWRLGTRFSETGDFVRRAERWDTGRAREYQLRQLRRICRIAFEKSAYYRDKWRAVGFDPTELRSLEQFAMLPIIDRDIVRQNVRAMCTRDPASRGVDTVSTGGTSGVPLQFYTDARRSDVEYAYLVACWSRVGYTPQFPQAVLRGEVVPEDATGLRHQYDPMLRRHYYSVFHMTDENMRRYVEHIATIGDCYLLVYPSSVSALVRYLERSGTKPPGNIRGVLAGSEIVYADNRARTERVLGVRCFSWYGHSEKLVLAAECEHSDNYHVWPTYGHFELIDEAGRPVTTPGQRGEIVGTGFINAVMPFIRYRTGDFATYVGSRCAACGREQTLITDIRGHRTQEMLVAADGALISWTAINMHDDTFDCVRQFQFMQVEAGRALLKVVPGDGFADENLERMRRNLGRKLDGRITFEIALVDSIPLTRAGKSTFVDQKISLELPGMNFEPAGSVFSA